MPTFILQLIFAAYLSERAEDNRPPVLGVAQFELHDYPSFPQVI
jgi:hypothetical protein